MDNTHVAVLDRAPARAVAARTAWLRWQAARPASAAGGQ